MSSSERKGVALGSMRVVALTRFPVKSLLGERLTEVDLDERGCVGDRLWSVRSATNKIGSGKNTRRFAAVPGLLELRAASVNGDIALTFPDGTTCAVDDPEAATRLSRLLGQELRFARESDVSHFDDGSVSLIGTASIDTLAAARGEPVAAERCPKPTGWSRPSTSAKNSEVASLSEAATM
jgi:uncharacterized protein YcbX